MFNKLENRIVRKELRKLVDAVNNFTDTPGERIIIAAKIKRVLHYIDEDSEQQRFAELLAKVIPTPFIDGTDQEVKIFKDAIDAMVTLADSSATAPLISLVEKINDFLQKLESELK